MKKRIKALALTAAMALIMMMSLSGCGDVDPVGLVKANLDYFCTGEITDELLEQATDQTEDDLKKLYSDDLNESVDAFIDELDCEEYATDEKRAVIEDFIKKAMLKAKYEVKDDYTEEDGVYYVTVVVYPMDFLQKADDYIDGEFTESWTEKITSGEYTYTTDEQLAVDMYDDIFEYLTAAVDKTGYLDGIEMVVAVEEVDGVYSANEDDLGAVAEEMMAE